MSDVCDYCGAQPDDWCPLCCRLLCQFHSRIHHWRWDGQCGERISEVTDGRMVLLVGDGSGHALPPVVTNSDGYVVSEGWDRIEA